ncbi:MAG: YncE family protein [bacterium]|nr:YncE family protein [bacterium]
MRGPRSSLFCWLVSLLATSAAWGQASAYVTNGGSNNVSVIDTATNTVTATINAGSFPHAVAVSDDAPLAYVANRDSATVSVIDNDINSVTATIAVGSSPFGIAVSGSRAYVANTGSGWPRWAAP